MANKQQSMTAKNKAFWKLPKATQRVAIAKDVIASFKIGFYKARTGAYFRVLDLANPIKDAPEKLDAVLGMFKKEGATCQVCGIGACFTSMVNIGNRAKTTDFLSSCIEEGEGINDSSMRGLLRKVFSSTQLTLIENAFEIDASFEDNDASVPYKKRYEAESFGQKFDDNAERLIAIMKNIIKNKGEFIP
jgi:hypothetical protein